MFRIISIIFTFVIVLVVSTSLVCANQSNNSLSDGEAFLKNIEDLILVDINEAKRLTIKAEALPEIQNSIYLQSYLHNIKAFTAFYEADYSAATQFFQQARILAARANNFSQQSYSYRREGMMLLGLGQYNEAISLLNKSLEYAHRTDKEIHIGPIYVSLANAYLLLEKYDQVLEYAEKILPFAQVEKRPVDESASYYFQSVVYIKRKEFEKAQEQINTLQKFIRDIPTISFIHSLPSVAKAKLALAQGKFAVAKDEIDLAIEIVENINYLLGLPELYLTKSEILYQLGEEQQALDLLGKTVELSSNINLIETKLTGMLEISKIFESKGDFENALDYKKKYIEEKEAAQIETERKLLTVQRAKTDLAEKEQQIQDLTFQKEISDRERKNQVTIIISGSFIAFVLALSVLILLKQKKKLKQTSIELKRADNAKSAFLARMSHEIRTPINAVIGLTKLSLKSSEDKNQTINLQHIEESSNTLLSVINDILDFSKIDAGQLKIENKPFNLDELINQCIRLHKLKAMEKRLELIPFIHRDVPLNLIGDKLRLQQILNNLLSNAIKFTDAGSISLIVKRKLIQSDLALDFEVKDTGIGIDLVKFNNIFDSFTQADESTTRVYGGSGLGLTICKQLVELMGGKIWVESMPKTGSSFFFSLPFKEEKSNASESLRSVKLNTLKVLIIDNVELSAKFISDILLRFGVTADIETSGQGGIDLFRRNLKKGESFDLVLLSSNLSDISGIEVAAVMKQVNVTFNPKIIMLHIDDISEIKSVGKSMGIDGYLSKPVSVSSVFQAINEVMIRKAPNQLVSRITEEVPDFSDIRILLVEDNALNQKVAIGFLKDTKAEVIVANNGQKALDKLQRDPDFDVILMDIEMPVMDGLTTTTKLRKELMSHIPVVAMTAHAMTDEVSKFLSAGMDAHIPKPVDPLVLYKTIQNILYTADDLPINSAAQDLVELSSTSEEFSHLGVIDKQKALKAMMGNEELYLEMVDEYIALKPHINRLKKAIDNRNLKTILRLIHATKPSLHYIGAFELANYIVNLEKDLKQEVEPISDNLIMQLANVVSVMDDIAKTIKTE